MFPCQKILSDSRSQCNSEKYTNIVVQILNIMPLEKEQFILENQGSLALKMGEILSLSVGKARGPQNRVECFR